MDTGLSPIREDTTRVPCSLYRPQDLPREQEASPLRGRSETRGDVRGHGKRPRSSSSRPPSENPSDSESKDSGSDSNSDSDSDGSDSGGDGSCKKKKKKKSKSKSKKRAKKKRPTAGEQSEEVQKLLKKAIAYFRCYVSARCPFPSGEEVDQGTTDSWDFVQRKLKIYVPLTPKIEALVRLLLPCSCYSFLLTPLQIKKRASHVRGELVTKTRPMVQLHYGLRIAVGGEIEEKNRALVVSLKTDDVFHFGV